VVYSHAQMSLNVKVELAAEPRTKPVPIRLDKETRRRLDDAARKLSSKRAAVVRLAIHQLLPDIEAGTLILKP